LKSRSLTVMQVPPHQAPPEVDNCSGGARHQEAEQDQDDREHGRPLPPPRGTQPPNRCFRRSAGQGWVHRAKVGVALHLEGSIMAGTRTLTCFLSFNAWEGQEVTEGDR